MNPKNFCLFLTIVFFSFLILPGASLAKDTAQLTQGQANQNGVKLGFKLMGGSFLLMRNDINDHFQSADEYFEDSPDDSILRGGFSPINMGMDFSGEILINFTPNIGLGIGAGFLSAGKECTARVLYSYGGSPEETFHPAFSAIPITLSLYFGIPFSSHIKMVFSTGAGYYLGKMDWEFSQEYSDGDRYEETWSAKAHTLGLHGGIHFEFGITRNSAFIVGVRGRYAKLTELTGELIADIYEDGLLYDTYTYEEAKLWYVTFRDIYSGKEYQFVSVGEMPPLANDYRLGEVNLSGIVFQAGIKITF